MQIKGSAPPQELIDGLLSKSSAIKARPAGGAEGPDDGDDEDPPPHHKKNAHTVRYSEEPGREVVAYGDDEPEASAAGHMTSRAIQDNMSDRMSSVGSEATGDTNTTNFK